MVNRKGIILAGGTGSRLGPMTKVMCKQLLPVFDKPLVYYPLCSLMIAGVREILIITTPRDRDLFIELLGDGLQWGLNLQYVTQEKPNGIAEAFLLARDFLLGSPSILILGDNIFHGPGFAEMCVKLSATEKSASILALEVDDPRRYGVLTLANNGQPEKIVEKPKEMLSRLAVPGIYFMPTDASNRAEQLSPSDRGELEMTDLLNLYIRDRTLQHHKCDSQQVWFDAGTCESLLQASCYVKNTQEEFDELIGYPEVIALKNSWITKSDFEQQCHKSIFYDCNARRALLDK